MERVKVAVLTQIAGLFEAVTEVVSARARIDPSDHIGCVDVVLCPAEDPVPFLLEADVILADPPLIAPHIFLNLKAKWIHSTHASVEEITGILHQKTNEIALDREERLSLARIESMNESVLQVPYVTIREVYSYVQPPMVIRVCLEAMVALLVGSYTRKYSEWRPLKAKATSRNIQATLAAFKTHFINPRVVKQINANCFGHHLFDKSKLKQINCGIFTFLEWMCAHLDHLDLLNRKYTPKHPMFQPGFQLTRTIDSVGESLAEYCIGAIISHQRRFKELAKSQDGHKWGLLDESTYDYKKLDRLNVFILGTGNVGRKIAAAAKCFGCEVAGLSKFGRPADNFSVVHCGYEGIADGMLGADFVINTLPSTPQTKNYISLDVFRFCKRSAVFINIGGHDVVSDQVVISAIQQRLIDSAVLDVFSQRVLDRESPLWLLPNVTLTPGVACSLDERDISDSFLHNLDLHLSKKPAVPIVSLDKGY